jgi:hypothetical protein
MADDAGTQVERELLAIEASLAALADRINTLTKGKKGNPLINARIRGLREELRRAVKANLADEGEGTMEELAFMPGADPNAPPADPNAPPAAGAPAAGPSPKNANELALMISLLLNISTDDFAGMWAAIKPALDAAAGGGDVEGGDIGMAKEETTISVSSSTGKTDLARDELVTENTALQARVAALELAAQTAKAEAKVDHDIGARSLPVGVRPVLVKLALEGNDALYTSVLDNAKTVPTTERGTTGAVTLSASTLTEVERQAAVDMGYDPEAVAKWKAEHANG